MDPGRDQSVKLDQDGMQRNIETDPFCPKVDKELEDEVYDLLRENSCEFSKKVDHQPSENSLSQSAAVQH